MSKRLKVFTSINITLLLLLGSLALYIHFTKNSSSPMPPSPAVVSITPTSTPTNIITPTIPIEEHEETLSPNEIKINPIILSFVGDVNFSEGSRTIARYDKEDKGIQGVISADLIEEMNQSDIMMLNNEFPYSLRGKKTPNKSYTFRAAPKRIELLQEMGVDIVSLANNHALDYGEEALLDTFDTLENYDIDYIGAGINMDRAKETVYYTIGDTTIAYLAASRVVFATDWYATDTRPGMIGIYDPTLFIGCIEEAATKADYVVTYLHWGKELQNIPEEYQRTLAKQFIDAGADIVIGCHPHVLQGFEFYQGKPIAYSLGNYWFNASTNKTGLLKLYLDADKSIRLQMLPASYSNAYTSMITSEEEKASYYEFLRTISFNADIDDQGFITDKVSP